MSAPVNEILGLAAIDLACYSVACGRALKSLSITKSSSKNSKPLNVERSPG